MMAVQFRMSCLSFFYRYICKWVVKYCKLNFRNTQRNIYNRHLEGQKISTFVHMKIWRLLKNKKSNCNLQLCNFYQKLSQYLTKNYKYLFDLTKYTGKWHEIMYYNKLSYSKLLTLFDMKYHKYVMYLFWCRSKNIVKLRTI